MSNPQTQKTNNASANIFQPVFVDQIKKPFGLSEANRLLCQVTFLAGGNL